jgi:hypothetical protein
MTELVRSLSVEDIDRYIRKGLRDYLNEGPDNTAELLELGKTYKLDWVPPA